MPGQTVYLDSSAIVKRYLKEEGTETVDDIFTAAERRNTIIYSSLWNIGEVIGVFDRYDRKKIIKIKEVLDQFLNEVKRLSLNGTFQIIDVNSALIAESTEYITKYHIYVADAIQIASCKYSKCEMFFTADKTLHAIAKKEKIKSTLL